MTRPSENKASGHSTTPTANDAAPRRPGSDDAELRDQEKTDAAKASSAVSDRDLPQGADPDGDFEEDFGEIDVCGAGDAVPEGCAAPTADDFDFGPGYPDHDPDDIPDSERYAGGFTVDDDPFEEDPKIVPGTVRFLAFYTWSALRDHLVSLRDANGRFIVPNCFTALQATRSAQAIMSTLRETAVKQNWELNVQIVYVPIVCPEGMPYAEWQRCSNPHEQSVAVLQYMKRPVLDAFLQRLAPGLPEDLRVRDVCAALLEKPRRFCSFFRAPENRNCHVILLHDAAGVFFGSEAPCADKAVNVGVIRPEWVVDARPYAGSHDMLAPYRHDPELVLEKMRPLLVTTEKSLAQAMEEERALHGSEEEKWGSSDPLFACGK